MTEYSSFLGPILTAIIVGYFAKPYLFNRGMHKIKKAKDTKDLFDIIDPKFMTEFVQANLHESYFLAQTGIETHAKVIPLYIALMNKLGIDCKWSTLKAAKPYLHFTDTEIQIDLSKWRAVWANVVLFMAMMFYISGLSFFYYYSAKLHNGQTKEFITLLSFMFLLIFVGFILLQLVHSTIMARVIQKKLYQINQGK